jgi:hypothetical protein
VLFKGRVIFNQYIPKEHTHFGINTNKLFNITGCTYNMSLYLGKDWQNATQTTMATYASVESLTRKEEGNGQKLYMRESFSSLQI